MKKILSIVITSFNIEEYIFETLNSLVDNLDVDLRKKIEIIIVDDCSTDDTCKKILEFKSLNDDVALDLHVNEKNYRFPGVGLNKGLSLTKGEFVHIVDGDDLVNSYLYNGIIRNYKDIDFDVMDFVATFFYGDLQIFKTEFTFDEFEDAYPYNKSIDKFGTVLRKNTYWQKIYKREFIISNKIKFVENRTAQDMDFNIKVFSYKPRIKYYNDILLFYRCGLNSISTNLHTRKLEDNISAAKHKLSFFPESLSAEYSYLIGLFAYTYNEEIDENFALYGKNDIINKIDEPTDLNFFSWISYFCHDFYMNKNKESMAKLIDIMSDFLCILNVKDRKLMSFLSSPLLRDAILLYIFLELDDEKYSKKVKALSNKIDLRRVLIDSYKNQNTNYNNEKLLEIINIIIDKTKSDELISNLALPEFINSKQKIKEYLKTYVSYETLYEYKYTMIIVHYNRVEYVLDAINSFIDCNYKESELIIVDNNSNIEHKNSIKSLILDKKNIKIIELDENIRAGARNYGIASAKGNFISFLDDDDYITPNFFKTLDKYIIDNTIDLARYNTIYVDENKQLVPESHFACIGDYKNIILEVPKFNAWSANRSLFGSGALCVYNRRNLTENSFIERIIYEDTIMLMEQFFVSKNLVLIPEPLYFRRRHDSSIMSGLFVDNSELLIRGHYLKCLGMMYEMDKYDFITANNVRHICAIFRTSTKGYKDKKDLVEKYMHKLRSVKVTRMKKLDYYLEGIDEEIQISFSKKYRTNNK